MNNWERDRDLRARLSAIEAVKGIGNEWYEQRERLYSFQFETGFYTRTAPRADSIPQETPMHDKGNGSNGHVTGSTTGDRFNGGAGGDD